jgi:hypothetical protein
MCIKDQTNDCFKQKTRFDLSFPFGGGVAFFVSAALSAA